MARRRKNKPKTYRSNIVDLSYEGQGVARVDGKTVFVHGALPKEEISFTTYRSKRKYDLAIVDQIHCASDQRVAPRCAAYQVCGGCALQHLNIEAQRAHKRNHLLYELRSHLGEISIHTLEDLHARSWNYRRRARLGVKYVPGKHRVLVGFRERKAPYIADMHHCEVLSKPVDDLIDPLSQLIEQLSVRRRLPQIEVAVGDSVTALVFRILDPLTGRDEDKLRSFANAYDIDVYLQPGGLDSIRPLGETRKLSYRLPEFDVELHFAPLDFIQINAELNRLMIGHVLSHIGLLPGDNVLDLFCGLGNFSLPLARCVEHVTGIEGEAALVEKARANCQNNSVDNVEFHVANLFEPESQWPWIQKTYDVVMIDPPRAGAIEMISFIQKMKPRVIAYVSCHPSTLARDAAELVRNSTYSLVKAGIMDMFPHTAHVESLAVFARN